MSRRRRARQSPAAERHDAGWLKSGRESRSSASEGRSATEDQPPALGSSRQLDPQHRRRRSMKTRADSGVATKAVEVEVAAAGCHLAGIDEQRHVEAQAVRDPAPFQRFEHAVTIAKTKARIGAKGAAA